MKYIVDRIEGEFAVCEKDDRTTVDIRLSELPSGVQAGDVIIVEDGIPRIDRQLTKERKAQIKKLADELFE
ncbi:MULTISPECIES: DUF3006 domain-containing protein [Heyndrickxia]|jgi:hypothetical protein|uniref:DUF3006 domain-containing protein n=2 Tax=Heyndrickxia coagulans TaxID=1398 RepID=A0A150KIF9_HEYCO|nr:MULTISPECIES: DUF3006 domain-containing protein [Heyndrickxia]AJH78837.1 hypothetical protein BF29_2893 [Heyndrickxia coagulans DSM 1 = ATCC 7050]AVD55137.1 DUF3006 domain-containing protein [Heyndrickxia coagulans]KYC73326.1 hypothetical protein B4099_0952 [Heyndrickxia coagulans]MCI1575192.1 DUF3006 domain-containing protein [Heyndrickxia coagulans]MCR2847493.1 DUF3006 domain-containing protein [Heyndrickxia coagulans]